MATPQTHTEHTGHTGHTGQAGQAGPADETVTTDLACRTSGRYEIVLLLDTASLELTVSVADDVTGVVYELPVPADEALDVFNHPFAHPAFRGVSFDDGHSCG
jgi:hypothetical protein